MTSDDQTELFKGPATEGVFDDQLSLPAPFGRIAQPVALLVKRDGGEVTFDTRKIADAIFRAGQAIEAGDRDLSYGLATAVALYLSRNQKGDTPTSEDVDHAVERVLFEMGHSATALAYIRHRDRRGRMRSLREGELKTQLSSTDVDGDAQLFVKNSDDSVGLWDKARIVQALILETGLDAVCAHSIAESVEQQINSLNLMTPTAALVRELVGARLLEQGLDSYRARHARLGVPLYDAEQIITAPQNSPDSTSFDPDSTGRVLARQVKREFALGRVFSQDVADAHRWGDIHIHDLGEVDRLYSVVQPMERLKLLGMPAPDGRRHSLRARRADTLIAQLAGLTTSLRRHLSGPVQWDAVNYYLAPFVASFDDAAVVDIARVLLYELAYRNLLDDNQSHAVELGLSWTAPSYLHGADCAGPLDDEVLASYGEQSGVAQRVAIALLEVYRDALEDRSKLPLPTLRIRVSAECFESDGFEEFLRCCGEVASRGDGLILDCDREALMLPFNEDLLQPRETVAHRVSLNVARASYRSRDETELYRELDRLFERTAEAHLQKRDFLRKLFEHKQAGPLGLLAKRHAGVSWVELEPSLFLIGVTGLNECVQALVGEELHTSEAAMQLAERLMAHLSLRCEVWGHEHDIVLRLSSDTEPEPSHRFAELDLQYYHDQCSHVVKSGGISQDVRYTPGTELNATRRFYDVERLPLESRFHPHLGHGAVVRLQPPDTDLQPEALFDLTHEIFHRTLIQQVAFER